MDVIIVTYHKLQKKTNQFSHKQLDSLFEDNITNQILATFLIWEV